MKAQLEIIALTLFLAAASLSHAVTVHSSSRQVIREYTHRDDARIPVGDTLRQYGITGDTIIINGQVFEHNERGEWRQR